MEEKSVLDSEYQSNFIITDHGEEDDDYIEDDVYLNFQRGQMESRFEREAEAKE